MCTSSIARVEHDHEAIAALTWLGSSFFSDLRLARFALDTWGQVGRPEQVEWSRAGQYTSPVVEIWTVRNQAGAILGAMTVHYYSWGRMRAQRYFVQSCAEPVNAADCLYIQPFEDLVAGHTSSGAGYDVAVELGYVAVDESLRGRGIGTQLFNVFLERSREASLGRSLAFTIVMSRHAHSTCGQVLMSHMIEAGANDPTRAVSLRDLAAPLGLPMDLLELEPKSMPTARLALRQGFAMAGYGKNLGQVWIRDMQEHAIQPAHHALTYPQISLPSNHLVTPTISMTMS
jgi:GNAT superfamily N-acetyltransferase